MGNLNNEYYDNYLNNHGPLMTSWANEVRSWVNDHDCIFYLDGIFDPDTWFAEDFRPLFILKEVNEQKKEDGSKINGIDKCINFIETGDAGNDPWKRIGMWHTLQDWASALLESTDEHENICKHIAILNLKKLAGGGNVGSVKSKKTLCYECHAIRFADKIKEQIKLINPTVIICCSKDIYSILDKFIYVEKCNKFSGEDIISFVGKLKENNYGHYFGIVTEDGFKIPIIEYQHPAAHKNHTCEPGEHIQNMEEIRKRFLETN